MYLPSAGICLWVGMKGDAAWARYGRIVMVVLGLLVLFLVGRTFTYALIWKDSVTLWSYVIAHYPQKELAYNNRAVAYGESGRYELAIKDHTAVLTFPSNKALAFYNRGLNYRDWAQQSLKTGLRQQADDLYRQALADFNAAIQWDPHYARTYNHRAMVKHYFQDEAGALDDLNKAIERDPDYAEVYLSRGNVYAANEKLDLALHDYHRAIELGANGPQPYNNIGIIYARRGMADLAMQSFNKALLIDAGHAEAYFNRSVVLREKGQIQEALADARRAISLGAAVPSEYLQALESIRKN